MDQISPGECEGVDETGIHDQAAEICDLGGCDVSGQGEEQVKAAKYYGGLCSVHPKFACYEFSCIVILVLYSGLPASSLPVEISKAKYFSAIYS